MLKTHLFWPTLKYLCRLRLHCRKCVAGCSYQCESISECQSDRFETNFKHSLAHRRHFAPLPPHGAVSNSMWARPSVANEASILWSTEHNAYTAHQTIFFLSVRLNTRRVSVWAYLWYRKDDWIRFTTFVDPSFSQCFWTRPSPLLRGLHYLFSIVAKLMAASEHDDNMILGLAWSESS